jgi:peroxiredoxin
VQARHLVFRATNIEMDKQVSFLSQDQLDARVITTDRKAVRVGDLLGTTVVLAFFPAAFTSVCTAELCSFRDSLARLNDVKAKVYGISVDLPMTLKVFAEQNRLNFPLLSDCNREVIRAFDVVWPLLSGVVRDTANRAIIVVDATGEVVYRWVAEAPSNEPPLEAVYAVLERART